MELVKTFEVQTSEIGMLDGCKQILGSMSGEILYYCRNAFVFSNQIPQTVLALRGSDGFSRDRGGGSRVRSRRSDTHFDR